MSPCDVQGYKSYILSRRLRQVLMTRPREEWKVDVLARYKALEQLQQAKP